MFATRRPRFSMRAPIVADTMPLPSDDTTPPVTNTNFVCCAMRISSWRANGNRDRARGFLPNRSSKDKLFDRSCNRPISLLPRLTPDRRRPPSSSRPGPAASAPLTASALRCFEHVAGARLIAVERVRIDLRARRAGRWRRLFADEHVVALAVHRIRIDLRARRADRRCGRFAARSRAQSPLARRRGRRRLVDEQVDRCAGWSPSRAFGSTSRSARRRSAIASAASSRRRRAHCSLLGSSGSAASRGGRARAARCCRFHGGRRRRAPRVTRRRHARRLRILRRIRARVVGRWSACSRRPSG